MKQLTLKQWQAYQKEIISFLKQGREREVDIWIEAMVKNGYDKQHLKSLVRVSKQKIEIYS